MCVPVFLCLFVSLYICLCVYDMSSYNEGLVDIVASSVQMIGEPRRVFPLRTASHGGGSPVL